jgi:hypothetical protein
MENKKYSYIYIVYLAALKIPCGTNAWRFEKIK